MKYLRLLVLIYATAFYTNAQTSLPYTCSFDNTAAVNGWTQHRNAGASTYSWVLDPAGYSSGCLSHYYPVSSSAPTDDWYVSPAFNFASGGKIDSLRMSFSGFGTPGVNDTVAIYLLKGSANPKLATNIIQLFDFRNTNYNNDGVWRKISSVSIPATSGTSYIAFKYYTTNNWLDVKFDNLKLSANSTTGLTEKKTVSLSLFPNPAGSYVYLSGPEEADNKNFRVKLYAITGQLVTSKNLTLNSRQEIDLQDGVYFYELYGNDLIIKTGRIIVKN